jgi:hypothetical protein
MTPAAEWAEEAVLNEAIVEQRLLALEQAVADLQKQVTLRPQSADWLAKVVGSISDEAAFLEALEYGRVFRNADRPEENGESP